jgi:rubredoxin
LRFLGHSAESFFNLDKTKISTSHFGPGPWPCLNQASGHYKMNTIFDIKEHWSNTAKDYFGVFQCPKCGYTYKYKSSTPEKISTICYGTEWENKFRMLLNCHTPITRL